MQERLMTKKYIAIIYEGEKTERQLVDNLNKDFIGMTLWKSIYFLIMTDIRIIWDA